MPTRRNRRNTQGGGGIGGVVTFGNPSFSPLVNNGFAYAATSSCGDSARPGLISGYSPKGLLSGGRRKGKSRSKKQRGGAYGFGGGAGIVAGYPGAASYAPVTSIGCTAPSSVMIPSSGADGSLNRVGGALWDGPATSALQRGGSYQLGETLATAGYTQLGPNSTFGTAAGTQVNAIVPVDGRSSACGMKGGRRSTRRKGKAHKAHKKSKKSKKHSKKSRK